VGKMNQASTAQHWAVHPECVWSFLNGVLFGTIPVDTKGLLYLHSTGKLCAPWCILHFSTERYGMTK
jgi:hypothetical protein